MFLLSPCRTHALLPVPSLPFLPTKPVVVAVAVAVEMLTARTRPPHLTSIAAAGAVGRWFAAASSRSIFRAVSVDVALAEAAVEVTMAVNVDAAVGRGCGRSGFPGDSKGRGTGPLAAATT